MDDAVIKVKVQEYDKLLREHGRRLDKIEQDSAAFREQIKNLCSKIDELTGWVKALVLSIVGIGIGFIIWYIQSLPR